MKLILFDADGTLIDSQAIIHEAMRLTFMSFDFPAPEISATRSIIGLTLDLAIAQIAGRQVDELVMAMTAEYKSIYLQLAQREEMQSQPFVGIPDLVRKLASEEDVLLGVVTGKSRRGVEKLFASNHFGGVFVTSRCADDCPSKPHPAMVLECCEEVGIRPQNTIVIGDTAFDMEMARSAGASALGVSWGYHPVDRIVSAGAHHLAHTSQDLSAILTDWRFGGNAATHAPLSTTPDIDLALQYA